MQDDRIVGPREGPVQRVASRVESQPPVPPANPVLAQQFSRLMTHLPRAEQQAQAGPEPEAEAKEWDPLKRRAFRCAEESGAAGVELPPVGQAPRHDKTDGTELIPLQASAQDGARAGTPQHSIQLDANPIGEPTAADLADALVDCVRTMQRGGNWRADVLFNVAGATAIRLNMECNGEALHLRFSCQDPRTRRLIANNTMLLKARLIPVSPHPVIVDIEPDGAGGDSPSDAEDFS
jgi:hypothetical protein